MNVLNLFKREELYDINTKNSLIDHLPICNKTEVCCEKTFFYKQEICENCKEFDFCKELYRQERLMNFVNHCNFRKPLCPNHRYPHHIITKDRDKAINFMEQKNAVPIKIGKACCEWRLDEEIWVWKQYNQRERGIRFFQIAIDKDIDFEFFNWIEMISSGFCFSAEIF